MNPKTPKTQPQTPHIALQQPALNHNTSNNNNNGKVGKQR